MDGFSFNGNGRVNTKANNMLQVISVDKIRLYKNNQNVFGKSFIIGQILA